MDREVLIQWSLAGHYSDWIFNRLQQPEGEGAGEEGFFHLSQDPEMNKKRQQWEAMKEEGYWDLTLLDRDYPEKLRQIPLPPPVIYGLGDPRLLQSFSIALVGSRQATAYGLEVCRLLSCQLSQQGVCIVSGLAFGIDAAAHAAAMGERGRTLAVIGSGIDYISPRSNLPLARQLIRQGGCLISEFPLGCKTRPFHFQMRNRLLSGLAEGVVVVQAALKSGTMITVRHAAEQGRELFAVPGDIRQPLSQGPHWMIQNGAKLCQSAEDILEAFPDRFPPGEPSPPPLLEEDQQGIYDLLLSSPLRFDQLLRKTAYDTASLWKILTVLQMKGLAYQGENGSFHIRRE